MYEVQAYQQLCMKYRLISSYVYEILYRVVASREQGMNDIAIAIK